MAIKNGDTPDANQVMEEITERNAVGILMNCITNDIAGLYGGAGELAEADYEEEGFFWSTDANDKDDEANTTMFRHSAITPDTYYGGTLVDDFEDASLNTAIWNVTDTPVTEGSGNMLVGGSGTNNDVSEVCADGASATDYKTLGNDVEIIFTQSGNGGGGSAGTNIIGLSNNSSGSPVTLLTESSGPSGVATSDVRIQIDNSLSQARAIANGSAGSWVSISGLSQWRLYFKHTNSAAVSGNPGMNIAEVRHLTGAGGSTIYRSTITTLNTTVTGALFHIPTSWAVAESSSTTYELTADNGSNWETVTPGSFHRFTNTGTQMGVRITVNENTSSLDVTSGTNDSILPQVYGIWGIRWSDNG